MQKIWLASYPAGVPAEVDVRPYPSLNDMLRRSYRRFADRPAFVNMGVKMTYGELDRLARDFGAYLQSLPGTRKADRVANVEQTAAWIGDVLKEGEETVVTALPLYHVFALTANLLVFVKLGGRSCEFGVMIADAWRKTGIAGLLP